MNAIQVMSLPSHGSEKLPVRCMGFSEKQTQLLQSLAWGKSAVIWGWGWGGLGKALLDLGGGVVLNLL